ncbi:MAG: hypothetical protein J6V38_02500, partial [Kiritimatiellae bacterium]|nr:hypothetical protein [Kiritimatiellia bacterium]
DLCIRNNPHPGMHHMHPAHEREGDPASVVPAVPIRSFRLRQASCVLPSCRKRSIKNMFQV